MIQPSERITKQAMLAREQIDEVGFSTIKNFFAPDALLAFESCIIDLFLLQVQKIGEYRDRAFELQTAELSNFEKFCAIYEMMEADDKEALYQSQKFLPASQQARALFNDVLLNLAGQILGSQPSRILLDGPALVINRPNTERLLDEWHSEAHYDPKRRRFLSIWLPLFDKKTMNNGTMSFKARSHQHDFPFSDYQGYNKDTHNKSNHFVQYGMPSNHLTDCSEHWCETARGDLVFLHRNLVQASNPNASGKYSVAVVARIWDPTDELTLSGSIAATPDGGNVGRPGLVVRP